MLIPVSTQRVRTSSKKSRWEQDRIQRKIRYDKAEGKGTKDLWKDKQGKMPPKKDNMITVMRQQGGTRKKISVT